MSTLLDSQTFADIVSTTGVVGLVAAFFGTLVVLMERTHRRTQRLSRGPFGADSSGDSDARRLAEELRAAQARRRWSRPADRRGGEHPHTPQVPHRPADVTRRLRSV